LRKWIKEGNEFFNGLWVEAYPSPSWVGTKEEGGIRVEESEHSVGAITATSPLDL
jgi:hypothetical protein